MVGQTESILFALASMACFLLSLVRAYQTSYKNDRPALLLFCGFVFALESRAAHMMPGLVDQVLLVFTGLMTYVMGYRAMFLILSRETI